MRRCRSATGEEKRAISREIQFEDETFCFSFSKNNPQARVFSRENESEEDYVYKHINERSCLVAPREGGARRSTVALRMQRGALL